MYPDFIGIGAQKAGTTWLHRNIVDHPQIWIPRKEVHYFDKKIKDHSNVRSRLTGKSLEDQRWRKLVRHWTATHLKQFDLEGLLFVYRFYMRPYNDRWYASIFEPRKGRIAGEITPAYSTLGRGMVSHVHEIMPDAKLIFLMRNPIERDWSQTVMSFDKAEKGSAESVSEEKLLKQFERKGSRTLTDYLRTLETWQDFYPEEQIFVGFTEDVHFYPEELLRSVFGFLSVDTSYQPPTPAKKVHSRSSDTMSTRVAAHLAGTYKDELMQLEERFGGYTSFWRYCGARLSEGAFEEERIPYPLWDSSLWDEWKSSEHGTKEVGLMSGPLSSLQAVR
jgi:hypothetical protein